MAIALVLPLPSITTRTLLTSSRDKAAPPIDVRVCSFCCIECDYDGNQRVLSRFAAGLPNAEHRQRAQDSFHSINSHHVVRTNSQSRPTNTLQQQSQPINTTFLSWPVYRRVRYALFIPMWIVYFRSEMKSILRVSPIFQVSTAQLNL